MAGFAGLTFTAIFPGGLDRVVRIALEGFEDFVVTALAGIRAYVLGRFGGLRLLRPWLSSLSLRLSTSLSDRSGNKKKGRHEQERQRGAPEGPPMITRRSTGYASLSWRPSR